MVVAVLIAVAAVIVTATAEYFHSRRVRRLAPLAFGPSRRPALWAHLAPALRVAAAGALTWGLVTLLLLTPKVHKITGIPENAYRDLLLVLDVSPSMRLADAGPDGKQTRRKRAAELLKSFFERVPMEIYKTTVVAVYNGAKPVVIRTTDPEVVRNILGDLPMEYAFKAGPTDLFAGLEEAARIAHPWRPRSTTLVVVSDGDTIPPTGMPKLPASIEHVLIVGVGDPATGRFIDGHLSRQDTSSLRQMAVRLKGTYHNGNEKHLPTDLLRTISVSAAESRVEKWTRREYALLACAAGAAVLALLPLLLHLGGSAWKPGVRAPRQPGAALTRGNVLEG
jgi:Ca-activated chloride channel family protein